MGNTNANVVFMGLLSLSVALFGQINPSYLESPVYTATLFSSPAAVPYYATAGDLNMDGRDDVVTCRDSDWLVILGSSAGALAPQPMTVFNPFVVSTFFNALAHPIIGDFNRDGIPDVVMTNLFTGYALGSALSPIYLGNGLGQFNYQTALCTPSVMVSIQACDFDLDGYPELIAHTLHPSTVESLLVFFATGPGGYAMSAQYSTGLVFRSPTFADVTGDGLPELVSLAGPLGGAISHIYVQQGTGVPASFGQSWTIPLPPVTNPAATIFELLAPTDLNGNGAVDFLLTGWDTTNNSLSLFTVLNPLSGAVWWSMPAPGFSSRSVHIADVNGDGFMDVAGSESYGVSTPGGPPPSYLNFFAHGRITAAIGLGYGQFQAPVSLELLPMPSQHNLIRGVTIGDFDGDGDSDLAFCNAVSGQVGMARNRSRYGSAAGGWGGYAPQIGSGIPALGNSVFSISLAGVPGNSAAVLGLSLAPLSGPSGILIDLSPANLILPTGALGLATTHVQGTASIPLPIPLLPALAGTVVFGQWGLVHPSSPGGWVLSCGATFIIM